MKGQTAAVSAILITGITVAAVASTYVWGVPLIEKQQDEAELRETEQQIFDLKDSIEDAATGGSGSVQTVDIDATQGEIVLNDEENYIDVVLPEGGSIYTEEWALVDGQSLSNLSFGGGEYALQGEEQNGVIAARRRGEDSVQFRVEFRNMLDQDATDPEIEKIDLVQEGASEAVDETTIEIENLGQTEDQYEVAGGESYPRTKTTLSVGLR